MTIEFHCPDCNKLLRTSDEKAGARAKCPDCGTPITVPKPDSEFDIGGFDDDDARDSERYGAAFSPGSESSAPTQPMAGFDPEMKNCPMCGAQIRKAAVKCRYCGESIGPRPRAAAGSRRRRGVDVSGKVQGPAIALMVMAGLAMAAQVLGLIVNLAQMGGPGRRGPGANQPLPPGAEPVIYIAAAGLGLLVSALIMIGAIKMKNLSSYGFAMTASILAMLPCSACCLLGIPFGIWSLVVLNDPDVKAAFR